MDVLIELGEIISRHATSSPRVQTTAVTRLNLFRTDQTSTPTPMVYEPMLCVVVAGRKRTFVGSESLEYAAGDALLVTLDLPIRNVNRTVGTLLGHHVTKQHGGSGLPDDTITVNFTGSAGMSFGAFLPKGITLNLSGDANGN